MKKQLYSVFLVLIVLFLFSCLGQSNFFIPAPDFSVFNINRIIEIDNIIETKDGVSAEFMPEWLLTFINGGNRAVEQLENYRDKYVFVGVNEGRNFIILNKWTENFTAEQDFAILAAIRIEERMIASALLFPDDEYGLFFQTLIRIAYGTEYQDAVKEETYWYKRGTDPEIYNFFIMITIDRNTMQSIIRNMMAQASSIASPTGSQAISVNRIRQTFFEGF
jgi:hypothetical protein